VVQQNAGTEHSATPAPPTATNSPVAPGASPPHPFAESPAAAEYPTPPPPPAEIPAAAASVVFPPVLALPASAAPLPIPPNPVVLASAPPPYHIPRRAAGRRGPHRRPAPPPENLQPARPRRAPGLSGRTPTEREVVLSWERSAAAAAHLCAIYAEKHIVHAHLHYSQKSAVSVRPALSQLTASGVTTSAPAYTREIPVVSSHKLEIPLFQKI